MEYEPWIESAETFGDLKKSLTKRGYRNLPLQQAPKHMPLPTPLGEKTKEANSDHLVKKRSMLRKGSDQARLT